MNDWADRIIAAIYAVIGAILGSFAFLWLSIGASKSKWSGWVGFIGCVAVGGLAGWLAHRYRNREVGLLTDSLDSAEQTLLMKRVFVVIPCLVGLYFLWDLAMGGSR
jgi:uncharacterized membrane protein YeaQ/YmgE (transglycosylase-associated protein family)